MAAVVMWLLLLCAETAALVLTPQLRGGVAAPIWNAHAAPALLPQRNPVAQPRGAPWPAAACTDARRHGAVLAMATIVKETPLRSFVKAAGWRFTAGVVTAASSFIFTGSLATAASIVGWDLFSKSGTMFIGERLWNNVKWGKSKSGDSSQRSLAKALAWRLFAALNTLFAATVLTKGKAGVAGKIAGSDSVVKTVLFFFYERVWAVVAWGKYDEEEPEPEAEPETKAD
mmetsp:Transcript_7441/g.16390  ORF Transcript_7441/g.16390 Transcript_7441/m.16390 type:complete len:229 (-) Transcript_7441:790-1476(-)